MQIDRIAEIRIDEAGRLCVSPETADFAFIYRSAMEVHWEPNGRFLYSPLPRKWTYVQWFQQILDAAMSEYGYSLVLSENTLWNNIHPELKEAITSVSKRSKDD